MLLHLMLQAAAGTANVTPKLPDPADAAWTLSSLSFDARRSYPQIPNRQLESNTFTTTDIYLRQDTTNSLFVLENTNKRLYSYHFGANADGFVGNTVMGNFSSSLNVVDASLRGLTFHPDGTRAYMVGNGNDRVYQFTLGEAWNAASISLTKYLDLRTAYNLRFDNPQSVRFNYNGRKMYVMQNASIAATSGSSWAQGIFQFSLGTAWEIDTAVWDGKNSFHRVNLYYIGLNSKSDGNGSFTNNISFQVNAAEDRFYYYSTVNGRLVEVSLTNAREMSSAQVTAYSSINPGSPQGIYVNSAVSRSYIIESTGDQIVQYNATSPGNAGTFTNSGVSLKVGNTSNYNETNPQALAFRPDGTRMYFTGSATRTIFQLDLSNPWELSSANFTGADNYYRANLRGYDTNVRGLHWRDDGMRFYIVGSGYTNHAGIASSYQVQQFDCANAWDIWNITYAGRFTLNTADVPTDIFIEDTVMMISAFDRKVYRYSLGSGWNVTTASHVATSIRITTSGLFQGLHFGDYGYKMFLYDYTNYRLVEYDLGGPFDITQLTFVRNKTVGSFGSSLKFNDAGTVAYITESGAIREVRLGTPWNISTLNSNYNKIITVPASVTSFLGFTGGFISPDGTRFFTVSASGSLVKYNLSSAFSLWSLTINYNTVGMKLISTSETLYFVDMCFSADGRYLYAITATASDNYIQNIRRYYLSTEWNIDTMQQDQTLSRSDSRLVNSGISNATTIGINNDGTQLYLGTSQLIVRIALSTPFSLNTVVEKSIKRGDGYINVNNISGTPMFNFELKSDYSMMYLVSGYSPYSGNPNFQIYQMPMNGQNLNSLPSDYDASWRITRKNYASPNTNAIAFNPGGTALYTSNSNFINRYQLSTPWDITTNFFPSPNSGLYSNFYQRKGTGYVYLPAFNGTAVNYFMFSEDGRAIYSGRVSNSSLYFEKANLSTAWELESLYSASTGAYITGLNLSVNGFAWSPDGMKVYYLTSTYIYERTMPYAFFLGASGNTGTSKNYRLHTAESNSRGLYLRSDGGAYYICGGSRNSVYQYNMTIPWNVTTSSIGYELFFSTTGTTTVSGNSIKGGVGVRDIKWKLDGTKFLVLFNEGSAGTGSYLHAYSCTVPYNLSTATWENQQLLTNQNLGTKQLNGFTVSSDGRRLYATTTTGAANGTMWSWTLRS